jgi:hypothetical protein
MRRDRSRLADTVEVGGMARISWSDRRSAWRVLAAASGIALLAAFTPACSNDNNSSTETTPVTKVFVQKFRYHGMPKTLSAGFHEFLFENKESFPITHEMIPVALPSGKTPEDIQADAKTIGPDSEDEWLHIGGDFGPADTDAGVVEWLYLPPGNYAIACWQTGTQSGGENGPPHAAKGMVFGFTVT